MRWPLGTAALLLAAPLALAQEDVPVRRALPVNEPPVARAIPVTPSPTPTVRRALPAPAEAEIIAPAPSRTPAAAAAGQLAVDEMRADGDEVQARVVQHAFEQRVEPFRRHAATD